MKIQSWKTLAHEALLMRQSEGKKVLFFGKCLRHCDTRHVAEKTEREKAVSIAPRKKKSLKKKGKESIADKYEGEKKKHIVV